MHIPAYRGTYIWGVCTFGALQPTADFSKNEGVLIFGEVLIYEFYDIFVEGGGGQWYMLFFCGCV